ncbi:MAG: serine hydrolase domain-containing protein [Bacteroidota bacterium]
MNKNAIKDLKKIVWILLLLASTSCRDTDKKTKVSDQSIDMMAYFEELRNKNFSGVILVNEGETITHQISFGYRDKANGLLNELNTIFDIGSLTKQFTAACILKLKQNKKIALDETLSKFFHNVPEDKKNITIHHLLTHSSGLVDIIGDDYEAISESNFVAKVFEEELLTPIGSKYNYSNIGYSLLTLIIEKVSGTSYEAFLRQEIFAPSNMNCTGYLMPDWDVKNIAKGYLNDEELKRPNEEPWDSDGPFLNLKGNGGLLSNASDLLKWSRSINDCTVLNKELTELYLYPHIKEYENGNSFYGYGWVVQNTRLGDKYFWHNGGNDIFFADMWVFPEDDLSIIVLCNKYDPYVDGISSRLIKILRNA